MSEEMFSDIVQNELEGSDNDPADMEIYTEMVKESNTEFTDTEQQYQPESENAEPNEESITLHSDSVDNSEKKDERSNKFVKLPLSRMKVIMKTDPSVKLVNRDALLSTARAAELFIEYLTSQAYSFTLQGKRKMITLKDVESAILNEEKLSFLEGAMDF